MAERTTKAQVDRKSSVINRDFNLNTSVSKYNNWKTVNLDSGKVLATVGTYHEAWQILDVFEQGLRLMNNRINAQIDARVEMEIQLLHPDIAAKIARIKAIATDEEAELEGKQ